MRLIVVDSSALIAILLLEDGHEAMQAVLRDPEVRMVVGAPTLVETYMVLSSRTRREPHIVVATLLAGKDHEIIAFDEGMVRTAYEAFLTFGKGRHPARLNYGDCMSYAVARALDAPLLYKGNDFSSTDVRSALG